MAYFFLCCVIVLLTLIYIHLVRNFNYWKNRNVPYIKPIPLFGNVYSVITFKKSLSMFLDDIHTKFKSPYFGFYVFDQPFLLVQDPELIKKVLVSDFDYFSDRSIMLNKKDKYSAKTLFMMKNPEWKLTRTKASPAFASGKIKTMVPLIVQAGEELVATIKKNALGKEFINCRDFSVQYAINVMASCAFGFKAQAHEHSQFAKATEEFQGTTILRGIHLVSHFFAPVLVKLFGLKFSDPNSAIFLEQVLLNALDERKASKQQRGDLIDLLIKMSEEDEHFDKDALVSLSLQYLIAGFETSGATIAYVLYELSLNKPIQDRLRNEILAVLKNYNSITFDAIQEMKYLDMVIKESLRKYPTLSFLDRRCTKEYKIPNSNVTVEKGIPIYISLWALHYDENNFAEPNKFDPERFSPENKSNIRPYTYMPFGEGYRNCLGTKFGMLSVCVAIIELLKNFDIKMSAKTPKILKYERSSYLTIPEGSAIHIKFRQISS